MQTLTSNQVCNQLLYRELKLNCIHQANVYCTKRSLKEKSANNKRSDVSFVLRTIVEQYNPDFKKSPFDFFYKDLDANKKLIFDHLEKTQSHIRSNQLKREFLFILDEVLQFHNTKHWLDLDKTRFKEYANAADRFTTCLNAILDLYYPTYVQTKAKAARYELIAHEINKYCKFNYLNKRIVHTYFERNRVPDFIDGDFEPSFFEGRKSKPKIVLEAVEKLSLAPVGYLTSHIAIKTAFNTDDLNADGCLNRSKPIRSTLDFALISDHFREELYAYCQYKVEPLIDKKRNQRWVTRKNYSYDSSKPHENILNTQRLAGLRIFDPKIHVPSFTKLITSLTVVIKEARELKILRDDQLTFFHLTQPDVLHKIYSKLIKESGFITLSDHIIAQSASSAWNPDHCFFYEYADEIFSERYGLTKDEIHELACENYKKIKKLTKDTEGFVQASQDSAKYRNKGIVALDVPASYVIDILNAAQKDINLYKVHLDNKHTRLSYLNALRDSTIVKCLMQIPLRARNWADMKYGNHPNCECIYKDKTDGRYIVSIPKHCFKNFNQKIIPDVFTLKLSEDTSEQIALYLKLARPVFLRGEDSEFFLISSHGKKFNTTSLGHTIRYFTARFGNQEVKKGGISVHYFRDIVATTFLKQNKGAFAYVAYLLLDSEKMIKEHYGHLTPADAFNDWDNCLQNIKKVG